MTRSLKLSNRYIWIGIIFLVLLALVSFIAAPATNRLTSGSTWNQGPDGYGAWYVYMEKQGAPIQRWQRPIPELLKQPAKGVKRPLTLVQIQPGFVDPNQLYATRPWLYDWLEAGNQVVILGQREPTTAASFFTEQPSPAGAVKIATRRRARLQENQEKPLLKDSFGAIAWRYSEQKGQITVVVTPYLAANAYLAEPGNFAFLSQLVTEAGGSIWVDEYLHGYKDQDVVEAEAGGSWLSYLAKTPLLVAAVQVGLVAIAAIIAQNRRLGVKQRVKPIVVDNSEAYIRALAGVLHKAESHDFVVSTLSKAERLALQKALGLGEAPISNETLRNAWVQATRQPPSLLDPVVSGPSQSRQEQDLQTWLDQLKLLHRSLVERSSAG